MRRLSLSTFFSQVEFLPQLRDNDKISAIPKDVGDITHHIHISFNSLAPKI